MSSRMPRVVPVALLLLGVGWLFAPASAPPLYDGVGFPDEPYRFVEHQPATKATKAPTTAQATAGVTGGRNGTLNAASAEQAPQVSVTIPAGMLRVSSGTAQVKLVARPEKVSRPPAGKYFWGNEYEVTVTPSATFTPRADLVATIVLRAPTAQGPLPFIARFDAGRWTLLPTAPVGVDVYSAELPGLGSYAVVGNAPLDLSRLRTASGGPGGANVGILVGGGVLVVVAGLYLAGRWRRWAHDQGQPRGERS